MTSNFRTIVFAGAVVALMAGCSRTPVEQLAAQLKSEDRDARYEAAKQLADYGPEAIEAVDELAAALTDVDPKVRYRSAKALSKIGLGAGAAADAVAAALEKADEKSRYYLVKTLANVEDAAVGAVDQLARLLSNDPNPEVRYYAAKALGKIGREAQRAAPALKSAQNDKVERVRRAAAEAAKKVTPA